MLISKTHTQKESHSDRLSNDNPRVQIDFEPVAIIITPMLFLS